jgi:predicted RNA-binding protein (virulence factor B family)
MMHLGQYNTLTILRFTAPGAYLGDDEDNVVLLPTKYLTPELEIGEEIEVFLYLDSEDRLVSTTEKPYIELNSFAFLKVKEVTHFGAFLDWGLEKDLLVPFKEQSLKMEEDKWYLVYLYLDEATQRLVASAKVKRYFEMEHIMVQEMDEVDLLICDTTELGKNVVVNDTYSGLIYKNDIIRPLKRGEKCKGYVTKVREDGKLDISLEIPGFQKIEPNAQNLIQYLQKHDGKLQLTDKSDPDEIREIIGMSKKTFKQAVGNLYKQRLIEIHHDHIALL